MVDLEQPREPWYRSKRPEVIVHSALAQAARKQNAGCPSCADAYIALARKNGATELQISIALGNNTITVEHGSNDDERSS